MTGNIQIGPNSAVDEDSTSTKSAQSEDLQSMAKGGFLGLVGRVSLLVFGTIFQIYLARKLGPANVGIVNLGLAVITIAGILAIFGLDKAVVRFIPGHLDAKNHAHVSGTIVSSLLMVIAVSLAVALFIYLSASFWADTVFNKPEVGPVLRILAFSLPFTAVMLLGVAIAQAFKQVGYRLGIVQTAVPIMKIAGFSILIFFVGARATSVAYALLAAAVGGAILALLGVLRLYRQNDLAGSQEPTNLVRPIVFFALPLVLAGLFAQANDQLSLFLLGSLSTAEQVGIYSISFKPAAFIAVSLMALNFIYAPFASELYSKGDKVQLATLFKTVTRWAVIISLPIFMVVFSFSPEVMSVFGQDFAAGVPVLRVLALSQLVFVATGPSAITLIMSGHPRLSFLNILLTLAITIPLGILLIPRYGAMGAAAGVVVTIVTMNFLFLIEVYFILRIHPYQKSIVKPIIACVIAMLTIGWLDSQIQLPTFWRLFGVGSLMVIIYFLILLALRLDKNDRQLLQIIKNRIFRNEPPHEFGAS